MRAPGGAAMMRQMADARKKPTIPGFPNKPPGGFAGGRIFGWERAFSSVWHRHSLSFGRSYTVGESGFRGLQPLRVRCPISGHGEALPPDQVAGGRPRNAVGSSAADHPDGPHASPSLACSLARMA
jgi:hypothetical protein